jgi:hypothetical protein
MKLPQLTAFLLALAAASSVAHDIELGPNGGRILEFSKDESMHGEVTEKAGNFHIVLLDKDLKPLAPKDQVITVTTGDRNNPEKLSVTREGDHFVVPAGKTGQLLIFQYRENPQARPVTDRFEFDTAPCEECKKPEWLCACTPPAPEKVKPK